MHSVWSRDEEGGEESSPDQIAKKLPELPEASHPETGTEDSEDVTATAPLCFTATPDHEPSLEDELARDGQGTQVSPS